MKSLLAIIIAIYVSFFSGFAGYYFVDKYLIESNRPACPKCGLADNNIDSYSYLDLLDFDILLVSPEKPDFMFHINHLDNRTENYTTTFLNYTLDGKTLKSVEIPFEDISWEQTRSQSDNSEYKLSGVFTVENKTINFEIPSIRLGMAIRAQPEAGKYGGVTEDASAVIKIDNKEYSAYAGVTAGFFAEYPPVDMAELGIKTHWAMYFDKDYNFYHLDLTKVQNPTPSYYSHAFLSQILSTDESVAYYEPTRVIGGNGVISLGYAKGLDYITKDFNLVSQTLPYRYAKMHLINEDTGGIGVYTYIDSVR